MEIYATQENILPTTRLVKGVNLILSMEDIDPKSLYCLRGTTTSRARPRATQQGCASVEAHHRVHGPDTGRNSGGRWIKKLLFYIVLFIGG